MLLHNGIRGDSSGTCVECLFGLTGNCSQQSLIKAANKAGEGSARQDEQSRPALMLGLWGKEMMNINCGLETAAGGELLFIPLTLGLKVLFFFFFLKSLQLTTLLKRVSDRVDLLWGRSRS